jgi:predicted Fe-Mo cluster-binding NifX family protein
MRREVVSVKVAVPEWNERVSPVFDTARSVLVVDIDDRTVVSRSRIELQNGPLHDRVGALTAGGVDVLLCGAVSRPLYEMLETAGIDVTPFLSGPVEVLLQAFIEDRISDPLFLMPGCCRRRRRRWGKRRNQTMKEGETT